jgi:phosphatidate cytidylyltransferase
MSNIVRRIVTGLVFLPIILPLLYITPLWTFTAFIALVVLVATWEFLTLSHGNDPLGRGLGVLLSVMFCLVAWYTRFGQDHAGWFTLACVGLVPLALLFSLVRPARIPTAFIETGALVLAPLYVGGLMATIAAMHDLGSRSQGAGLVVLTLMIAWFGDTGAMAFGKVFGGPKLYPAVSPNKTWSGSLGGLIGSVLGVVFAHYVYLPSLSLTEGVPLALVAGSVGQLGDLCESVLKRSAGVKDSGGLLPGHGGILDRIDALTFSAAVVYLSLRTGWVTLV